ncbi:MAG: polysaccharide deacetylase family protein, partial [Acidobacteriota bacterium]
VIDIDPSIYRKFPFLYRNSITAEQFREQMRHLKAHYRILDASQLQEVLAKRRPIERATVITFDDGLLNNATVTWPILREMRLPGFFFLPTGFVDRASRGRPTVYWTEEIAARILAEPSQQERRWKSLIQLVPELRGQMEERSYSSALEPVIAFLKSLPDAQLQRRLEWIKEELPAPPDLALFPADRSGGSILATMTWDQAKAMADSGMEIGAHSVNHAILTRISREEAEREIVQSFRAIEKQLSRPCRYFAYPNGMARDFAPAHQQLLAETGLLGAFTQLPGFNGIGTNPFALHRINIPANCGPNLFQYRLSGMAHRVEAFRTRN